MSENVLTKMVKDYKELTAMIDELKQEAESIADEIKAEMISWNTDEIRADIYKVRYKTVTSTRFDSKSFKEKYTDLYSQFTKQTTSRRFSIV